MRDIALSAITYIIDESYIGDAHQTMRKDCAQFLEQRARCWFCLSSIDARQLHHTRIYNNDRVIKVPTGIYRGVYATPQEWRNFAVWNMDDSLRSAWKI